MGKTTVDVVDNCGWEILEKTLTGWRCWQRIIVAGKMLGRTGGRYIDICGLGDSGEDFGGVGWSGVLGGDWRPFKGGVDGGRTGETICW